MVRFELSEEQERQARDFLNEQNEIIGRSSYGALGGVLTYSFTPTGVGVSVEVVHGSTGNKRDLTNYDEW